MSKRKYRFGMAYFDGWTLDQIRLANFAVIYDGEKFSVVPTYNQEK